VLPNDTNCPAIVVLKIPSSQIEVNIQKSDYQRVAN
jgi:hypothetical protein